MGSNTGKRRRPLSGSAWIKFALLGVVVSIFFQGALCEVEPTESQCRPYIEKALKEQHLDAEQQSLEGASIDDLTKEQEENPPTDELTDSIEGSFPNVLNEEDESKNIDEHEVDKDDDDEEIEKNDRDEKDQNDDADDDNDDDDEKDENKEKDDDNNIGENEVEETEGETANEVDENQDEDDDDDDETAKKDEDDSKEVIEKEDADEADDDGENAEKENDILERPIEIDVQEVEMDDDDDDEDEKDDEGMDKDDDEIKSDAQEDESDDKEKEDDSEKDDETEEKDDDTEKIEDKEEVEEEEKEDEKEEAENEKEEEEKDEKEEAEDEKDEEKEEEDEKDEEKEEEDEKDEEKEEDEEKKDEKEETEEEKEEEKEEEDETDKKVDEDEAEERITKREATVTAKTQEAGDSTEDKDQESTPEEEELIKEVVIPEKLRPRDHISTILKLEDSEAETILQKTIDTTLKSLKGLYDSAIKPLEMLYKYRDLSNRHFGDPEIFSKPLILFMGPWSGGKSSTINYLLDNEFSHTSLRTGAEPSPAYFNILMYGEQEEILDGTQLAADWTFSGLQKFGQSLLDRLKGIKLPNKLLEKVNIVEIPGILEIRKQVQRLFPFNDACQWFIDRADIIFLVYDPSKLDVGPETEAILDQLKGREYQTRIILNKADQVKPEELMRVQGTLIWNISPLMSSSEPPIMYSTSLWSLPYETGAPTRLLLAQERAFLRDLREAIDKRVENKIASARRFAVRVRNHAKMVDCYLTTYYNHKSFFGNRKKISDDIIEYPQKYHIYEGLSTLTNISRYDLPDPDVYRDFFKINPLYDFKKLSETCTYFRGCPINQLDVAIAYDLPELVGKYKKAVEAAKETLEKENS